MSNTDDLFNFLDEDGIVIPNIKSTKYPKGKTYTIPSPDVDTGIRLTGLAEIANKLNRKVEVSPRDVARLKLSDEEEREFSQQVLGSAYEELLADGVSWVRVQRLTQYAFTYFAFSPEAAEKAAREGTFSGKAPARNRATRRAAAKPRTGAAR